VKEAVSAGIEHIVIVLSPHQEAITTYFARFAELEAALENQGKRELVEQMVEISEMAEITYVHQHQQRGLGHAVLMTRPVIGDEPFAVFLPDDLIWNGGPTIGQMIDLYHETQSAIIAVREVPDEMIPSLGVIEPKAHNGRTHEIASLVEKPALEDAPSNLAIIGRYVLPHEIFDVLESTQPGALGEIQLTDAISGLLETQRAFAYQFPGVHFDAGKPIGMLKASIYEALQRDDMAADVRAFIRELVTTKDPAA
jgi:UTP--glucose-1-phosphate uridylyltransferase